MKTEQFYNFIDLTQQTEVHQFSNDIRTGLTASSKYLPVKYLYDEAGSKLFEKITQDKNYYLTYCEESILTEFATEIIQNLENNTALVELGSGSAVKTRRLIRVVF